MDTPIGAKRLSMDFVNEDAAPTHHDSAEAADAPLKKKQKRNKPTLSCEECVERKTKVRPTTTRQHLLFTDSGIFSVIV